MQQVSPQQGLERRANSNAARDQEAQGQGELVGGAEEVPEVRQEGPQPDAGPEAVAQEQEGTRAMSEGGQTAVAFPSGGKARDRPSLAVSR
jgi:hypothetical protein